MYYKYTFGTSVCIYYKAAEERARSRRRRRDIFGSCNPAKFSRPPLPITSVALSSGAVLAVTSNRSLLPSRVDIDACVYFLSVVAILVHVNPLSKPRCVGYKRALPIHKFCMNFSKSIHTSHL